MSSLEAQNVTVRRGERVLLDGVSCAVVPGEVLVVLGVNGAGKSTLTRVLSGEWISSCGDVFFDGCRLALLSGDSVARRRAVLPQSSPLSFPFSVREVVLMGRTPHVVAVESARDREIAEETMRHADVAHLASRNYLTLSGGEKQRVHWARVLAQLQDVDEARYLLLDEPVSNLDLSHQHACLELARTMATRGVGVMAVLHDLNLAAMYADRVLFLKQGKVAGCGRPDELFTAKRIESVFAQRVLVQRHPQRNCPLVIAL